MTAFHNKVIVITGVTRGIGRAAALRFIAEGAAVAGIYVSSDDAALELQQHIQANGGRMSLYKGSVTNREFIANAFNDIYQSYGRMDVLVNNAGRANDGMALLMPEEQWNDVVSTNFIGVCNCAQEAIPYLVKQAGGSIVNVVSVSGVYGREAQTNYAASKGAVIGLTKLLARRYASEGIRVSALAPGMIDTEMAQHVPEDKLAEFLRHTASGRLGSAEEIADAIAYLAGPLAAYTTGQVLKIDGGFLR
ncbi:3-oxoacyl-[acyl-carrier-protein] reductase FabG [Paenibacillus plantiphilus]|uniref:3-oxoacyl-[acyl-carrier-protein] reductase FabG n=1 Tax=Paenibacillus plantiphilus TaxID=2905650 RepID=A0ABM9BXI0_9BACL|nr:3-oxoacyl-ACP reductase family protein [Paenibacillus plantiphilus]CAH1195480.1 3-oxoacyl-[acyl-carrier-protein] reductase FabG [Paenibacillus plantiphilus]